MQTSKPYFVVDVISRSAVALEARPEWKSVVKALRTVPDARRRYADKANAEAALERVAGQLADTVEASKWLKVYEQVDMYGLI